MGGEGRGDMLAREGRGRGEMLARDGRGEERC